MSAPPLDPVFRPGGISYLHIPSRDVDQSAHFYQHVFGWNITHTGDHFSFADGTGHVIGAWVTDRAPTGDSGIIPYVYVDDVDAVLERAATGGGTVLRPTYPEGNLRVATFSDPSGTVIGAWQRT